MKLVSILMPIYNEPINYIKLSVRSVFQQEYPNLEYVFIIDDPTNVAAINYLKDIKEKNNNIVVLVNSKNRGLIYSLNRGLNYCKGTYVARMDADDIASSSRIKKEVNFMEKTGYDLVGSNYYKIDENNHIIGKTDFPSTYSDIKKRLKKTNCIGHPTWLVKKEVYDKLNGYRNVYTCEDYDFIIRIALKNYTFGITPEKLLKYRINTKGISQTNKAEQKVVSDMLRHAYRKNHILNLKIFESRLNSASFKLKIKLYKQWFKGKHELKELVIHVLKK